MKAKVGRIALSLILIIGLYSLKGCKKKENNNNQGQVKAEENQKPKAEDIVEVVAYRVYGKVYAKSPDGTKRRIRVNDKLNENDTIITTKGAEILLEFVAKTPILVKIKENSEVLLEKLKVEKVIKVNKGKLFTKLSKLTKKEKYIIKSPSIVAGVRGTEFVLEVEDIDKDGKEDGKLITTEGKVEVENPITKEKTYVDKDKKVEALNKMLEQLTLRPKKLSPQEKKKVYAEYGIEEVRRIYKKAVEDIEKRYQEAVERINKSYEETEKRINKSYKETEDRIDKAYKETQERIEKGMKETEKRVEEGAKRIDKTYEEKSKSLDKNMENVNKNLDKKMDNILKQTEVKTDIKMKEPKIDIKDVDVKGVK